MRSTRRTGRKKARLFWVNAVRSFRSDVQRLTTNDLSSIASISLSSSSNPSLKCYLSACKLLDVLVVLSSSDLYNFQLWVQRTFLAARSCLLFISCRQAFVVDSDNEHSNSNLDRFIAFSQRLSILLDQKRHSTSTSNHDSLPVRRNHDRPLLHQRAISNIIELYPFFRSLSAITLGEAPILPNETNNQTSESSLNTIEMSILEDFVESWI